MSKSDGGPGAAVPRLYDYAASANCYKVRLLLAELGRDYERVPVDIFAGETLSEEYSARNPALTTPVLEPEPGRYLPESAAILLFLAEGTELLPADPFDRAQVHRWLFFEQANVLSTIAALRFRLLTGRLDPGSDEARRLTRFAGAVTAVVDGHLNGHDYLVADRFSVADIALYGYLHVAGEAGVETAAFAHLAAWIERVRGRPAHVADLAAYPPNAQAGAGTSLYDALGV